MKKKSGLLLIIAIVVVLTLLVGWRITTNKQAGHFLHRKARPMNVDTATVVRRPMPVLVQSVGQVEPEHSVQIRPQVTGMLKRVYFTEGQTVQAGQRLFQIDPAPYRAVLSSAKSAWASAKANANRMAPLAAKDYVTPQEYQNARTTAEQAKAAYQQARINLSYTNMRSPISGRTGSLTVKAGNVVAPSDSSPLVVINQMQPILVQYTIPQQRLDMLRHYNRLNSIKVMITHEDGSGHLGTGKLVFIDNNVNNATGTVMLKAELPNKDISLWPGQYVGVNMQLTVQKDALVIPDSAVQTGQNGNFVYRVVKGKTVIAPVRVDRQVGNTAVIASGLKPGDTIITRVPRRMRPGIHVISNTAGKKNNAAKHATP